MKLGPWFLIKYLEEGCSAVSQRGALRSTAGGVHRIADFAGSSSLHVTDGYNHSVGMDDVSQFNRFKTSNRQGLLNGLYLKLDI